LGIVAHYGPRRPVKRVTWVLLFVFFDVKYLVRMKSVGISCQEQVTERASGWVTWAEFVYFFHAVDRIGVFSRTVGLGGAMYEDSEGDE